MSASGLLLIFFACFLAAAFLRGWRFLGLTGWSSSLAGLLAGAAFAAFGLVSAALSVPLDTAFLVGLASEDFASGLTEAVGLESTGFNSLTSDSTDFLFEGLASGVTSATGAGLISAGLTAQVTATAGLLGLSTLTAGVSATCGVAVLEAG